MSDSHSFITVTITKKKHPIYPVRAIRHVPSLYPDELPQQVLPYPRKKKRRKAGFHVNQTPSMPPVHFCVKATQCVLDQKPKTLCISCKRKNNNGELA